MARTHRTESLPQVLNPLPAGTRAILRPGSKAVAYHIPDSPSSGDLLPLKTTIVLPRNSAWTSGLHFHATHTEHLRLVKGAIFVELNGKTKLISTLAGGEVDARTGQLIQAGLNIEVPRYVFHNWGRLEHYNDSARSFGRKAQQRVLLPEDWAEEVVMEEWTDPSDITKPLFFWNLNGIITAAPKQQKIAKAVLGDFWVELQLFVVFWELDNWPVFNIFIKVSPASDSFLRRMLLVNAVEVAYSFTIILLARLVGLLLGLKAVEQRRTPDALWEAYRKALHGL